MISDSHTDFMTELKTKEERACYVEEIKAQGVKSISCAVFTSQQGLILSDVKKCAEEINELKTKYGVDLLFSVEDLGFLKEDEIEEFIRLKPISTTLTWHDKNQFAGGDISNGGLTKKGKEIVKKLEQNNILVDTAHMNKKSFWQFVKITKKPIYNSHSNIYSLHRHKRNLTDRQIEKIVETGGYLGLTIYDEFVAGKKISSLDIAKQFDYLIKKFGYLNFGFGTDFYGISQEHLPTDIQNYIDIQSQVNKHLLNFGHTKEVVERIFVKNWLRFINFIKKSPKSVKNT